MPRPRPWQRQSKRIRRNKCILSRPADFFGGPGVLILYGRAGCPSPPPDNHHAALRKGIMACVGEGLSCPPSCPPIGALPRNRLASSATGGASPISPPAGNVSLRTSDRCHWCGNPHPRPQGPPCRKGAFLRSDGIFSQIHKKFSLKLQMQLLRVEFLWYTTSTARKNGLRPKS